MQKKFLHTSRITWAFIGCFMSFSFFAYAQTTVNISANPAASSNVPLGTSNYAASESIYTATELGSNFITTADAINSVSFTCGTLPTTGATFSNLKIYFKDVTAATTTFASGTYSTTGYTLVYSGSITLTAIGVQTITLSTPYTRVSSTNNLQMLIERTDNLLHTGNSFATANGNNTSSMVNSCRRYNSTLALSGTTSLTASAFRPAIILQHFYTNDAAVQQVYTLGKLPIPYANPHIIRANISNAGIFTLTNIPVTLNVTGANTFTDVQTIASLAPGANTTVSFLSFSPTVVGTNSVNVSIPADDFATNNSLTISQTVSGNAYTYAYGTANNGGVGFTGNTGDFIAKFSTSSATTVNQAQVNFASAGNTYKIGIWNATAGGLPNTLLWESADQTTATGLNTVPVSPPVAVSGDFFVGVRQKGIVNVNFAYQTETPIRPSTFYFTSPSGGTTWTDFAPGNSFKFMIEPKLTLSDDVALTSAVPSGGSNTELCGAITPGIAVANLGVNAQSNISIACTIRQGTTVVYTNTQSVASVASGASQAVSFGTYTPTSIGPLTAEYVATLASDLDNSNNTVSSTFNLVQNNFGTTPTYKYANSYACTATTTTPAPTYNWITQTTNEVTWANALSANGGVIGDDDFATLTIPFSFSFYGTPYTTAYASSNGWISFSDPTALAALTHRTTLNIPTAGGLENFIAGAWKDLNMNTATYSDAHLYYGGDASQYVITFWHAHNFGSASDYVTFQIILKPDGSVRLQFNDAESTLPLPPVSITNTCTIGMENAAGSEGVRYRYLTTGGPMFGSPMAVDMLLVTPLPLSLLSFDAKNNGAKNDLVWRTAGEENVSHFAVERSNDGGKYQEITKITANNDRNKTSTYTYSDAIPFSGNNYYRLKMIDRDGKFEYSNIEVVNTKLPITNVKIYPNPVNNSLYSSFDLSIDSDCELQVFDTFGKLVATKSLEAQKGRNNTSIDVTNLAAGVYFVKINIDGVPLSVDKFVKD